MSIPKDYETGAAKGFVLYLLFLIHFSINCACSCGIPTVSICIGFYVFFFNHMKWIMSVFGIRVLGRIEMQIF